MIIEKGIVIDNRTTFEPHVQNLCKKAEQKLHALARIANYTDVSKNEALLMHLSFHNFRIAR